MDSQAHRLALFLLFATAHAVCRNTVRDSCAGEFRKFAGRAVPMKLD
jgi:hypothetical protein